MNWARELFVRRRQERDLAEGWVLNRAFDAVGAEALSPAIDQRGFAAFLYEEVTWPHVTFQFGGRVDRTTYEPTGEDNPISRAVPVTTSPCPQCHGADRLSDDRLFFSVGGHVSQHARRTQVFP